MIEQNPEPKVTVLGQVRKEVVLKGDGILRVIAVKCHGCSARGYFRVAMIDGVVQKYVCWPNGDGDDEGKGACGVSLRKK